MRSVFSSHSMLFGLLLVAFIIVFEILLAYLKLPAWPAFMVMICFFIAHEDTKEIPAILIGGLAGILCLILSHEFIAVLKTAIGAQAAKLIFIGLFVYAIVLFKDALPAIFNSYAFMFFLVGSLAAKLPGPNPIVWMAVEFIVGGIFIVGILGINRAVGAAPTA